MVQNEKTAEAPSLGGEQSPSPVSGEVCAEAPVPVEESGIAVETTGLRKFISGVVEGKNDTMQSMHHPTLMEVHAKHTALLTVVVKCSESQCPILIIAHFEDVSV